MYIIMASAWIAYVKKYATTHKLSYKDTSISEDMIRKIEHQKSKTPDIYSALAKSIAPAIYGMEDIKKALLLLLVSSKMLNEKGINKK
jgi:DNA replication licensing factor MCM7